MNTPCIANPSLFLFPVLPSPPPPPPPPHTHTNTCTNKHSGATRLTHQYKYIFTPPVMCLQQLSLLHWISNSLISKIYFPHFLFKNHSLIKVIYLLKTSLFLSSTDNTDRNGVNKQNTHKHTQTQTQQTLTERYNWNWIPPLPHFFLWKILELCSNCALCKLHKLYNFQS